MFAGSPFDQLAAESAAPVVEIQIVSSAILRPRLIFAIGREIVLELGDHSVDPVDRPRVYPARAFVPSQAIFETQLGRRPVRTPTRPTIPPELAVGSFREPDPDRRAGITEPVSVRSLRRSDPSAADSHRK